MASEGDGAVLDVVVIGWGALALNGSHLHDNISGKFQTFPGIYCNVDGHDRHPVMVWSIDS